MDSAGRFLPDTGVTIEGRPPSEKTCSRLAAGCRSKFFLLADLCSRALRGIRRQEDLRWDCRQTLEASHNR